jgi:MFS family permease
MHASRLDTSPAGRSRYLALVVLCAGMLMIILDQTIVNVALPAIQRDLGFSQSSLAWVVSVACCSSPAASATCLAANAS